VLVSVAVVAERGPVHRSFQGGDVDRPPFCSPRRRLQVGERAPRVAARQPDQVIGGLVVERDGAAEPAGSASARPMTSRTSSSDSGCKVSSSDRTAAGIPPRRTGSPWSRR